MKRLNSVDSMRLDFSKAKLHGREKELKELEDSYESAHHTRTTKVVMVKGYSGSGKSVLVESLRKRVKNERGWYVTGKFDKMGSSRPFCAIVEAFSELCKSIALRTEREGKVIGKRLKDEMGKVDLTILEKVLPKIHLLLDKDNNNNDGAVRVRNSRTETPDVKIEWVFERLKFAFRDFLRIISSSVKTVMIIFIDDLQWADVSSLTLIQSLVAEKEQIEGLLFVGAYRINEVDDSHPLSIYLRGMERRRVNLTFIELSNLAVENVNNLIAEVTRSHESHSLPLAEVVHKKTDGNPFFVIQFLQMLQKDRMLRMSSQSYQWEWNLDRIQGETDVSDNVVGFVAGKIQQLPPVVSQALQAAACLGSHFHIDIISSMLEDPSSSSSSSQPSSSSSPLAHAWQVATNEGLIVHRDGSRTYKFVHDRIQQSAYSLIPEGHERQRMHLKIGRHIQKLYESETSRQDWMLLVFVNQLNRGADLISNQTERLKLAAFNLEAAEKVSSYSAFFPAAEYLRAGLKLTQGMDAWDYHYELELGLCNLSAEIAYYTGDFVACEHYVSLVLKNTKTLKDRYRAFIIKVDALGAQERLGEAVEAGKDILQQLGEKLPKKITKMQVKKATLQALLAVRGKSDEDLLSRPTLKDQDRLFALEIMSTVITFAWFALRVNDTAVLCLRSFMISLRHGLSKFSAYSFAVFGFMQGFLFRFDEAYRFGELALALVNRFQAKDCDCRTLVLIHAFLVHLRRPLCERMDPMLQAYQYGMETGDIHHSSIAVTVYTSMYFYSGLPLGPLLEDARAFASQMAKYNQALTFSPMLVYEQKLLNLMGICENPVVLTGQAMNQDEYLQDANSSNVMGKVYAVSFALNNLGYYFDDMDVAAKHGEKLWSRKKNADATNLWVPSYFMFMSLTALEMAKQTGKRTYRYNARKHIRLIMLWTKKKALNTQHKLMLVLAQQAALRRKQNPFAIKKMFDDSIAASRRSGFVPDAALSAELAGKYFLSIGDTGQAVSYLARAQEYYGDWGAKGKVDHMESKYHVSSLSASHAAAQTSSSSLRGRQRYTSRHEERHHRFNPFNDTDGDLRLSLAKNLSERMSSLFLKKTSDRNLS